MKTIAGSAPSNDSQRNSIVHADVGSMGVVAGKPLRLGRRRARRGLCLRPLTRRINPLFLHGPAGVGKSHLVAGLSACVVERRPGLSAVILTAGDFDRDPVEVIRRPRRRSSSGSSRRRGCASLVGRRRRAGRAAYRLRAHTTTQFVFTAAVGPALLERLPARLTSRLASGLIVGMEAWSPASRLLFLQDREPEKE